MSGRALFGPQSPWHGGVVSAETECVLAPNASPWTLDGTNTWIIGAHGSTCVVVDPGPLEDGHREAIESRLEERRHSVSAVVLTHGHIDHSAGADEFARRHGVGVRAWDPALAFSPAHSSDPSVLCAGESIDLDGLRVSVMATPGHSSDSVSLVVGDVVLTGDTVLGRGTSLVAHPDGRLAEYLESLRALSSLCSEAGIRLLLPGHGPVLDEPAKVIEYYLEHRQDRLAQVLTAVRAGATTSGEIVERVYADVPKQVWPAAESTVLAQLDYLTETGRIDI